MHTKPEYFYRFRSIARLIGANELENQEIYFASPEQLNDPMEGFKDIYWQGDDVVWNNLIKNYLFCLTEICLRLICVGEEHTVGREHIPIFSNQNKLPTEQYKELFGTICDVFFSMDPVLKYIDKLASRVTPIRRDELVIHLTNVHPLALEIILELYENNGLMPPRANKTISADGLANKLSLSIDSFDLLAVIQKDFSNEKVATTTETLYAAQRRTYAQLNLIGRSNHHDPSNFTNRNFVIRDFPEEYVEQIERLLYPEWYAACFMSDCSNASVWGHYGDKHAGVCLKFRPSVTDAQPSLNLYRINGWGRAGPSYGMVGHPFYKIDYERKHVEIDFFRSLGRLPIPELNAFWYSHKARRSICADDLDKSENEWRERYWKNFHQGITTKLRDWIYEKEYRLVLTSSLFDLTKPEDRKLKYNFSDLDGIIFGIKTKTEDKLKIMEIVGAKCSKEGRKGFNFYQAFYSKEKGCIDFAKMGLIKFSE